MLPVLPCFINLEYRDAGEWKYLAHPGSAFALAAKDSVLHGAGLTGDSVGDAQLFFDLSREELAEILMCMRWIDKQQRNGRPH